MSLHDRGDGDHLVEILRHVLLVVDANEAVSNLVFNLGLIPRE